MMFFLCVFEVKDEVEYNLRTFSILSFPLCGHHLLQNTGNNIALFFPLKQLHY